MAAPPAGEERKIEIDFTINGNATPETVNGLRAYAKEMERMVRRVIREEQTDAKRRAFA